MTHASRWTTRLLDAPSLPIAVFLLYFGVRTVTRGRGPAALEQTLPEWLTWSWAGALIVGGVLVIAGVAGGRTRAESTGHAFHLSGLGLYVAVNIAAVDGGDAFTVTVLAAVAALRMRELKKLRRAQQEKARLLREQP